VTRDEQTARCVSLLLRVLVQADGDVAILRAGDKPCLIGPRGKRPLANDLITPTAMRRFLTHLLPEQNRDVLATIGATQHELPGLADLPSERFTIDAEVGHDGPIIALRRLQVPAPRPAPVARFQRPPMKSRASVIDDTLEVPTAAELWGEPAFAAVVAGRRAWL
jgi:hypothetical protein